ncbi:MAG TPA: hypothetical protein VE130_06795 [Nitrososphaeraceae archaeon]|nr:hypothetical protein [Nitrososphaeraceae archaeon]
MLGNTDYRVTDKVARNLEKETNEVMKHDVKFNHRCALETLESKKLKDVSYQWFIGRHK